LEPGRFRIPRSKLEKEFQAPEEIQQELLPPHINHVGFVVHTRPEILVGAMLSWFAKRSITQFGFLNHGGTLNADGLLFVNKSSWAHILRDAAEHVGFDEGKVLSDEERECLDAKRSPDGVIVAKKW
jgi:hypothetical protein